MSGVALLQSAYQRFTPLVATRQASIARAVTSAIERLESRQLLATTFQMSIDFTSESSPYAPTGYHADIGRIYGDRNKGKFFGWSESNEGWGRNPNAANSPDERYDAFNHLRDGTNWSVAVPNGRYEVRIVAGDPKHIDSKYHIDAEGVRILDGTPTKANPWIDGIQVIEVDDGTLTITGLNGGNNKLAFLEIKPAAASTVTPVVAFSDNDGGSSEDGQNTGSWIVQRTGGDLSKSLVVNYSIAGNATNGADYQTLSGAVTIAAGRTTASITITPIDDSKDEPRETVTAVLKPGSYTLGSVTTASCTITDNDPSTSVNPSVNWSSAPSAPIGRVEPGVVQVGNKLFVMGGFDGNLNVNRRVDIFNLETQKWSRGADLPSGAAQTHGGFATDGNYIYLISGQVGGGYGAATTRSYRYDIAANKWNQWVSFPTKRFGGALVYLDGKLFYFGGDKEDRTTVSKAYWSIDTKASTPKWKYMGEMPLSGDHLGHAVIHGKIYIVGGEHGHAGLDGDPPGTYIQHDYLLEYNPGTDNFVRKADMLTAASHFEASIHVIDDKIVVFGGNDKFESQTNKIQLWNPATNKWQYVTNSVPDSRHGPASGIWNGRIYYTNGYSKSQGVTTKAYWGTLNDF